METVLSRDNSLSFRLALWTFMRIDLLVDEFVHRGVSDRLAVVRAFLRGVANF